MSDSEPPLQKSSHRLWIGLGFAAVLIIVGVVVLARVRTEEVRRAAAQPPPPLTEAQQEALGRFGEKVAGLISIGRGDDAMAFFDLDELGTRVVGEMNLAESSRAACRAGVVRGAHENRAGFFSVLDGQPVKFLRARNRNGFPAILLRTLPREGGMNYTECLVRPRGESFQVVDLYYHLAGALLSELTRSVVMPCLAGLKPGVLSRFFGLSHRGGVHEIEMMKLLLAFAKAGDQRGVVELLRAAPIALRDSRVGRLYYVDALQSLRSEAPYAGYYREYLLEMKSRGAAEPSQYLALLDVQFEERDYLGAEQGLVATYDALGGDPCLKFLIASVRDNAGNLDGAKTMVAEAVAEDQGLMNLTAELRLVLSAKAGDFPAILNELRRSLAEGHCYPPSRLKAEVFTAFLASPEGLKWQVELAASQTGRPEAPGTGASGKKGSHEDSTQTGLDRKAR